MRGQTARVVVGDEGVVGDGMLPGDDRHAAANPALDEQMHVDVREQFQLHLGHLQHGVPAEARRGVVVRRIETVMRHTRGAELLEDVGEQKDDGEQVQIEELCERRHAEGGPHLLGVGVVGVADVGLSIDCRRPTWAAAASPPVVRVHQSDRMGRPPSVSAARCGRCVVLGA